MQFQYTRKKGIFYLLILLFFFSRCANDKGGSDPSLILQWPQAYPAEDWTKVKTGLAWSLSLLGAQVPAGSVDRIFQQDGSGHIRSNPLEAGFNNHALDAMQVIISKLKESDEYKSKGAVDLGRFLVLSVYSSWNYYGITQTETTLNEFKSRFNTPSGLKYAATNSTVSGHDRIITFHLSSDLSRMYFLAEEGTGSVAAGTFLPAEYETIAFMPNGQPRFALYDGNGRLKEAADTSLSLAGKPGKCMWCHESGIQPLFEVNTDVNGYLTQAAFMEKVDTARLMLEQYRSKLSTAVLYTNKQDHTLSEWLYISFMEPSVYRLAKEWNVPEATVASMLAALPTHSNLEFNWINRLYNRSDVESFSPWHTVPVPFSVREKSVYEPDFFSLHP